MHPAEIEKVLDEGICILVDTREQPTENYYKRLDAIGYKYRREKLDFGDYSACYTVGDKEYSLSSEIVIERKMSLDEICGNFTKGRDRFAREFERAKEAGAKVHLIIENANYEKLLKGSYRSRFNSKSLMASLMAFCDRYDISPHFCKPETTPILIGRIFYHHIRNKLLKEVD